MLQVILQRVVTMFILVVVGFVCGKTNLLNGDHNRGISGILINVCLPCMCINSFQQELTKDKITGILLTLLLSAIMYPLLTFGSKLFFRKSRTHEWGISRHAAIYGNAGFMGIPIVEALLGNIGIIYATIHVAIINSVGFVQGDMLISGNKKMTLKHILNLPIIGILIGLILFLLRIEIPQLILVPIRSIGNMVTPMAMLMTGVSLSSFDFKHVENIKDVLKVSLFRMVLAPIAMILICSLIPIDPVVRLVTIICACCPSLAFTLVLTIRHQKDVLYSSEIISLTTLIFMGTLPLMMLLCSALGITI